MSRRSSSSSTFTQLTAIALLLCVSVSQALAAGRVSGYVYDVSGKPVPQASVTVATESNHQGPDFFTAFSDAQGKIHFPENLTGIANPKQQVTTRVLGYDLERVDTANKGDEQTLTIILRKTKNYAATAPASAWLTGLNGAEKENLLHACTPCHQTLMPYQRAYARLIQQATDGNAVEKRKELWHNLTKFMSYLNIEEFNRGVRMTNLPDVGYGSPGGYGDDVVDLITKVTDSFGPTLEQLDHYDYGAPLAVTPDTVIMEYEVPRPNAIREGVILGNPAKLYVADSYIQGVYEIDLATGKRETIMMPAQKGGPGSHSLYRDVDGTLWVTCTCSTLAHYDPSKKTWKHWEVSQHDLAMVTNRTILPDYKGRIWIAGGGSATEYLGNYGGIGYVDEKTGDIKNFELPMVEGRPKSGLVYSESLTSDRKHLWYTSPGNGTFGEFDLETLKFGKPVVMPTLNGAPHRLTITEDDILFIPLMNAGQLAKYDARAHKLLAVYDLPDRAAVDYAATYDRVRKVVWLANINADAIYRFDIKTEKFSVLPLPRQQAALRMVDVDPNTGLLTTSYANIPYPAHGPRMALVIDPGDHAYGKGGNAISQVLNPGSK